jgi:hypothetical protein
MPSILVSPLAGSVTSGGPLIGGVEFPRPSSADEQVEPARAIITLANGSTRAYDKGIRSVLSVSWSRMRLEALDALRSVMAAPFVDYVHTDGKEYRVGTAPTRYSVSITVREQDPRL